MAAIFRVPVRNSPTTSSDYWVVSASSTSWYPSSASTQAYRATRAKAGKLEVRCEYCQSKTPYGKSCYSCGAPTIRCACGCQMIDGKCEVCNGCHD